MPALDYALPEFGLRLGFGPTEFTQVNAGVNRVLVKRAVDMLDPRAGERVGDLFCGIGNFSLPLATRGAHVTGIEGATTLIERGGECARQRLADAPVPRPTSTSPGALARLGRSKAPHRSASRRRNGYLPVPPGPARRASSIVLQPLHARA
jgi:23S rRNA (uracil1939-C5)-methyltransferase